MNHKSIDLFPTTIHEFYIPELMIDQFREELDSFYESNRKDSGVREYFSTYNTSLMRIDDVGKNCELVSSYVESSATKILERRVKIDISFMNYVPQGKTHSKHGHAGPGKEIVSAILYLDNIGHTNFYDPRVQNFNYTPHIVQAKRGKCVLFPGWLEHEMPPHYESGLRVTVPFNLFMC